MMAEEYATACGRDGRATASAEPRHVQVAGHNLTLFVETGPLIAAMVRDIRAARSRVWLESYIIMDDAAGQAVAEALIDRAEAGLDVRVHYDAIGSQTTPSAYFRRLEHAGVRVHCFHALWEAFWRFSPLRILNRRNHRKLLVLDDRVAYFGGMNIVDQSGDTPPQLPRLLPQSAGWRDVHVRLEGPRQADVAVSFERSWRLGQGEAIERRPVSYRRALLATGEESIQFFDSGPGLRHMRAARLFLRLIRLAERRITLSMAYFLPVGRVLRQLIRAHKRGVFLRVVVPGLSDVPLVQLATRFLYRKLLRRHFHVFERQRQMLHSKVMIVDEQWCLLGSCNLDARSLWINLEFLAVIHSPKLAAALEEIVRHEIANSRRIRLKETLQRRWWQRLGERLAWELRWWL